MTTSHVLSHPARAANHLLWIFLAATGSPASAQHKAIFDFDVDTANPTDISSSGVVATVHGATHSDAGFQGGAFRFDGIDDWIQVGLNGSPLTHAFPQFSMGAFVRVDSLSAGMRSILSSDNGNFDRAIAIDARDVSPQPRDHGVHRAPRWSAFAGGCGRSFTGPVVTTSNSWRLRRGRLRPLRGA